ncbi:A-kinase anchor protein 17A [Octodon degus]|uniref:A-kinase anchor protein 17A n=1 Tax=Octodon degus TaxID=10160 RepID=A0A6P3V8L6_OCTDE|nr:A-kinase anchor protein 17A [Octodon degus]
MGGAGAPSECAPGQQLPPPGPRLASGVTLGRGGARRWPGAGVRGLDVELGPQAAGRRLGLGCRAWDRAGRQAGPVGAGRRPWLGSPGPPPTLAGVGSRVCAGRSPAHRLRGPLGGIVGLAGSFRLETAGRLALLGLLWRRVPAMAAATIVHDTSEAVELCPAHGLYLKPITRMTISVALPQLKQPGKSISNWEVMERLKGMVHSHQFSTLRISKSTMDFIRFEGEVENKSLVKSFLACLDGKTIKLSGFSDILKVRAAEFKIDFPTRHDWDSFFRDAKDMNETLPGERPDTIHLEGLPCKWFAQKESGSEKPSEEVLLRVFRKFGEIRNVDIPMLDPYREEMTGRNFHTFSFGGHLNFEAYVQYCEYAGFIQAMSALRGMKLMYKGEDGKAVACNIKVSFDSTKHLSDASIKKRQLERQKLQELEQQREAQKRREKEAEERQRAEERSTNRIHTLGSHRPRLGPSSSRALGLLPGLATSPSPGRPCHPPSLWVFLRPASPSSGIHMPSLL